MPKLIYRPDFRDKARLAKKQRPVARKNKDGSDPSTHLYEYGQVGNKFVAYPTLFPKSAKSTSNPKDWIELDSDKAYNEARRRGEVVEFNDEHSAKGFAAGAWKDVDENPSTGSVMNSPLKKNENKNKGKGVDVLKNTFFKEGGKMPLKKASGKGKAAVQKAVSSNIAELTRANREKPAGKKRSKEQIAAIAYSAARKK